MLLIFVKLNIGIKMKKTIYCLIINLFVILTIFSYCTSIKMYPGPLLPEGSLSILLCPSPYYITRIDGKSTDIKKPSSLFPNKIELLPGYHIIYIHYHYRLGGETNFSTTPIVLRFYTKLGHKYKLMGEKVELFQGRFLWNAWIEDITKK